MGNETSHPSGEMSVMYDLAYYNPKMNGNVYRGTRKCGKTDCKCATSPKNKHSFYRLEYRVKEKGRWRRKRKYVPKHKVKSLRQRIKRAKQRAKQRDMQRRQQIAFFMQQATDFMRSEACEYNFRLKQISEIDLQKLQPITLSQKTQFLKIIVNLICQLENIQIQ